MIEAHKRSRHDGYTIIEVVVALAVAGIALAALLHAVEGNAARSTLSREYVIATTFGESMMARVGRDIGLDTGEERGRMGGTFFWRRTIGPYSAGAQPALNGDASPVSPYKVTISVSWRSGGKLHELSLRSLRLKINQNNAN